MVVALAANYSAGAVELLGEYQSYHLVRERHARERNLLVGTAVHVGRESVRSADNEHQSASRLLLARQPRGHLHARAFGTVLVEQNHCVRRLDEAQNQFALSLLLLVLRQTLGILERRNHGDVERHVVADALLIVADALGVELVNRLAHHDEFSLHTPPFAWGSSETIPS